MSDKTGNAAKLGVFETLERRETLSANPASAASAPETASENVWEEPLNETLRESDFYDEHESALVRSLGADPTDENVCLWTDDGRLYALYLTSITGSELDLSGCRALTELYCDGLGITNLSLTGAISLSSLHCSGNALTALDLSDCAALEELDCGGNGLETLELGSCANLTRLYCYENLLTSLDLSAASNLVELNCSGNALTALELGSCSALVRVDCYGNALVDLELGSARSLSELDCSNNSLEAIDFSNAVALTTLNCDGNPLERLDLLACANLTALRYCPDSITYLYAASADPVAVYAASGYAVSSGTLSDGSGASLSFELDDDCANFIVTPGGLCGSLTLTGEDGSTVARTVFSNVKTNKLPQPEVRGTARQQALSLEWSEIDGAVRYLVQYKLSTDTDYIAGPTVTEPSATLTGLESGRKYDVRVKAVGDGEYFTNSSWTNLTLTTGSTNTGPVQLADPKVSASSDSGSVTLTWEPCEGASRYLIGYRRSGETTYATVSGIASTEWTLTGLDSETSYEFRVKAIGDGSSYVNSSFTTLTVRTTAEGTSTQIDPVALAAPTVEARSTSDSITLTWSPILGASRYLIGYRSLGETEYKSVSGITATTWTLNGLDPDTTYEFRVKAIGDGVVWLNSNWRKLTLRTISN